MRVVISEPLSRHGFRTVSLKRLLRNIDQTSRGAYRFRLDGKPAIVSYVSSWQRESANPNVPRHDFRKAQMSENLFLLCIPKRASVSDCDGSSSVATGFHTLQVVINSYCVFFFYLPSERFTAENKMQNPNMPRYTQNVLFVGGWRNRFQF